jgi:hypothetical protein
MAQQRTVNDRIADALTAYNVFREELTPENMRSVLEDMTGAQKQAAAEKGDVQAYAALVQASLSLQRLVFANDRTAMLAAVMATQSGVSRPTLEIVED